MTALGIAGHVVDRWRERVSPGADPTTAGAQITTYLTSPAWPGVVVVVESSESKAVTVLADEPRERAG